MLVGDLSRAVMALSTSLWLRPPLETRLDEFIMGNDVRVANHVADIDSQIGRTQRIEFDVCVEIQFFVTGIDAEIVIGVSRSMNGILPVDGCRRTSDESASLFDDAGPQYRIQRRIIDIADQRRELQCFVDHCRSAPEASDTS